jgi:error-prone DNA polymerase
VQEKILKSIAAFALYGFPESHAASFALLAYASAFLKCHYLPEFTAAMLNNQPMGFYHPATLIKDAQHHGLRVLPVDVTRSEYDCTVEDGHLRLGLRYAKGVRAEAGYAIADERRRAPFTSMDDLVRRVPELHRDELRKLARIGALNFIHDVHRRDALWESELVTRPAGPLFEQLEAVEARSPLAPMTTKERLYADFSGTGVTVGRHPMAYYRPMLAQKKVLRAIDLASARDGLIVRVAGAVIVRQRPGTAKGFLFLSLEDETGISNIIVHPDMYEAQRPVLIGAPFVVVEGVLQNQQGSISVRAGRVESLDVNAIPVPAHNFH